MRKQCLTALLLLACSTTPLALRAAEVEGVKLDDQVKLAGQDLVLNGAGVRTRAIFKVYVAGLYLPRKADTTPGVLALKGPKRVHVSLLRDITSDDLGDALLSGIRKNSSPDEVRRFGLQLVQLGQIFGKIRKLSKGDFFLLDWVPGKGTLVIVDGKPVSDPLEGEDFFNALLRIWLGEHPADTQLKPALLGKAAAPAAPRTREVN